jgi:multidrug resistance efflux pump
MIALVAVLAVRQHRRSSGDEGVYSGTIEAEESRVGSTVGGRVAATLAREGESIHKGQRLVTFESDELDAALKAVLASERQASDRLRDLRAGARPEEIDRAKATVAQAQSQYEKLRRGSRPEESAGAKAAMDQARQRFLLLQHGPREEDIDRAQAAYEAAKADRELADASYKRIEGLFQQGAVAAQARDEAQARAQVAVANETAVRRQLDALKAGNRVEDIRAARDAYNQAGAAYRLVKVGPRREDIAAARDAVRQSQAALAELRAGTRPYQIAQAEAALHQARAGVEQSRARARERAVFAPRSGRLEVLSVQAGDIVSPGQPVATVINPRDLYIRIYVSAGEIGNLGVGAKLPVVSDSGVRVTGTVTQIPVQAEFTPRNVQTKDERALQVYAVKIRLPNPGLQLRAGMSADVRLR